MKRPEFDVMLNGPDGGEPIVQRIQLVWKDQLDGEREGLGLALNQDGLTKHQATLAWHAAMVRLGFYSGGFYQFVDDLIGVEKVADVPLNPTNQAASPDSV